MSEFTEARDKVKDDARNAWKGSEPTTRSFLVGVAVGVLIVFSAFLVWRLS